FSATTSARVCIAGLYPGVDLELHERDGRLEYDLALGADASTDAIALELDGADGAEIDPCGTLCARLGSERFCQLAPLAWQELDGERRPVPCRWRALDGGRFGFEVDSGASFGRLVIDPVLVYGSFVGGSSADEANAVVLDEQGCAYVTGWARSSDFPHAGQA